MNLKTGLLLVAFFYLAGCQEEAAETQRPNIIYLMADDQRADAFGFAGNDHIITPNLDKLASDGVTFKNAYHVAPICQPSRASVMTGQYLSGHGAGFDRPTNYILTSHEFEHTYPVQLREHGYFTGFIGKFGFAVGGTKKVKNDGFENKQEYMPTNYFDVWNGFPGQGGYFPQQNKFNGYENRSGATHLTEFMADQATEFLQKALSSDKPFALSISFKAPHAPFTPAKEFRAMYDSVSIPRMVNDEYQFHQKLPQVVQQKSRNAQWYFGRSEDYYGNEVGYRRDWHIEVDSIYQEFIKNYYALITGVDHAVGQIREELEQLGVDENTVIIYTSDNGFFAGSRQLMGKALLYEESVKAPMIVYDPRQESRAGIQTRKGLISHVDIAPTILDLAGVNTPESYPGKSFLPLVYNEKEQIHEAVYGENNFDNFYPIKSEVQNPEQYQSIRSRFVRTPEFKYIRYHENQPVTEELFKVSEDTLETDNLIVEQEYSEIAEKLRSKMDAFEDQYINQRSFP
ncbi:sulfatase-like hydrolase/transferase [Aliifodinibius sp. S!AR15-10]|uniref:sulfatase-like hydrolase/transferase n=1 Tax=Aliifodinibius sp. S!AR15-10 TaxID=2950437 RepID=UPI002862EF0A|nr:sulfatase-like hydrolase/transferase [Aliifodinibius sp. S!AR15-10]MDR8394552.1 sulfatase-like hydrolase/transferase [Aliifodinibius sp. S!AR15-10]